jgi:hypothetical protein
MKIQNISKYKIYLNHCEGAVTCNINQRLCTYINMSYCDDKMVILVISTLRVYRTNHSTTIFLEW